jgi:hypothetical protein
MINKHTVWRRWFTACKKSIAGSYANLSLKNHTLLNYLRSQFKSVSRGRLFESIVPVAGVQISWCSNSIHNIYQSASMGSSVLHRSASQHVSIHAPTDKLWFKVCALPLIATALCKSWLRSGSLCAFLLAHSHFKLKWVSARGAQAEQALEREMNWKGFVIIAKPNRLELFIPGSVNCAPCAYKYKHNKGNV